MLDNIQGWEIFTIRDVLTSEECLAWIERAEDEGFATAPIYTERGERIAVHLRDCYELSFVDEEAAALLTDRIGAQLAGSPLEEDFAGVSERIRVCRYGAGQHFVPHTDMAVEDDSGELASQLTLLVYLNDDFGGGETVFLDNWRELLAEITPEEGVALCFDHDLLHAGQTVLSGDKYIIRADLMFTR